MCDAKLRDESHTWGTIVKTACSRTSALRTSCVVAVFSDADLAGNTTSTRLTTGGYVMNMGPNIRAPIAGICKTQHALSHSPTVTEILALDYMLGSEGLPALGFGNLWQTCCVRRAEPPGPRVVGEFRS